MKILFKVLHFFGYKTFDEKVEIEKIIMAIELEQYGRYLMSWEK